MEIENLKFIMCRIDSNISNTNTKATIIIGINTFLIGALINNMEAIDSNFKCFELDHICVLVSIFGIIMSLILAAKSVVPIYKNRKSVDIQKTAIFFGYLSELNLESFRTYTEGSEYNFADDMIKQIIEISKIAKSKHDDLQISMMIFFVLVIIPWLVILCSLTIGGDL